MRRHTWRSFRRYAWRERSTWIGAAMVACAAAAVAASFVFTAEDLHEYGARWHAMAPILTGISGVGLMLWRTARGRIEDDKP